MIEKVSRPRLGGMARREVFATAGLTAVGILAACSEKGYRPSGSVTRRRIERVFEDPVLEAGRLLKEAAEIEQDLMVQYLYSAFSLKPAFAELIGYGAPEATSVLGVAIQEMQHLRAVNALLGELGFAPVLSRHDFPEETSIYPFPFHLEPMSRESLAKYVYCEAPAGALVPHSAEDEIFVRKLTAAIGADPRPNHVGSLYDSVIDIVAEVAETTNLLANPAQWQADLNRIKGEGEQDHYLFFRGLFESTNPLLSVHHGDVWQLPRTAASFPVLALPVDPTAYPGHARSIEDPTTRALAWLGNLTYWLSAAILDLGYRYDLDVKHLVQSLMLGPLVSLARALPTRGAGLPFDPLSMAGNLSPNRAHGLAAVRRIAREAITLAHKQAPALPSDFSLQAFEQVTEELNA